MLYLLRHGQTDWNVRPTRCQGWADVPLNDVGREQARTEGGRLAGRGIRRIVTSHLVRARETAEIVRAALDVAADARIELTVDERLAESRRGDWEGRFFFEIMATDRDTWLAFRRHPETFRFPAGESLAEQQRRVLAAVRDAAADGRTTLLVTHGGSVRLVRAFAEDRSIADYHKLKVPNGRLLEVPCRGCAARIDAFLSGTAGVATGDVTTADEAPGGAEPADEPAAETDA
jgi:probable phosphoglycerate mutase